MHDDRRWCFGKHGDQERTIVIVLFVQGGE